MADHRQADLAQVGDGGQDDEGDEAAELELVVHAEGHERADGGRHQREGHIEQRRPRAGARPSRACAACVWLLGHCPSITTDHAYFDQAYLTTRTCYHAYLVQAYLDQAYLVQAYFDQAYFCHCSRTSGGRMVLPLPSSADRS